VKNKLTIRKGIILTAWLLVGGGMIVLLAAANRERKEHVCQRVVVNVKGDGEKMFIEKTDVLQQLNVAARGSLLGKPIVSINLVAIEQALEKHSWIRDVKLYFDSRDVLHVSVAEREPIARVFTKAGNSFYIDSAGGRLPLLEKVNVRVLVVTNSTSAKKLSARDSLEFKGVKDIARYINSQPFWNAQIAQVDVTPSGTFELVPVIGNHIIRIGNADDLHEKLGNLLLFYKQVGVKTGFGKYAVLDVQYKNQVIGSREKYASTVDSIQLQKNIEALIRKSMQAALQDSLTEIAEFNAQVHRDSTIKILMTTLEEEQKLEREALRAQALLDTQQVRVIKPKPVSATSKAKSGSKPVKARIPAEPVKKPKPKAVMKRTEG